MSLASVWLCVSPDVETAVGALDDRTARRAPRRRGRAVMRVTQ
jgi:hypothetical protein